MNVHVGAKQRPVRFAFHWVEAEPDDELARDGWLLSGQSGFHPVRTGDAVAHDVLEHFPGARDEHGPVADELLALGARLYVRVASGWWCSRPGFLDVVIQWGLEIGYLIEPYAQGPVPQAPPARPIKNPAVQPLLHDIVQSIAPMCRHHEDTDDFPDYALAWLQRGYHDCVARYGRRDPYEVMRMSECLTRDIDEDHRQGEPGDQLLITVDSARCTYTVDLV